MDAESIKRLKEPLPLTLYGEITVNGKTKSGEFRYKYNRWSDRFEYLYYTPKGNKGSGGFSANRARILYVQMQLSATPLTQS